MIIDVFDHCRIGSLESQRLKQCTQQLDHCRIGSLEKKTKYLPTLELDHCRIGSLEIMKVLE